MSVLGELGNRAVEVEVEVGAEAGNGDSAYNEQLSPSHHNLA